MSKLTIPASLSERDRDLLARAEETFYKNIITPAPGDRFPWGTLRGITPSWKVYRGLWNWDTCFHAMAVTRFDPALAREQLVFFFDHQREDGCIIDSCEAYGDVTTRLSKPPVIFWACETIDQSDPDDTWLADVYPRLVKCERFWCTKRCERGLFYYSSDATEKEDRSVCAKWESGWDTSPRYDGNITEQIFAIDLNCYMITAYAALAYLAARLGKPDEASAWEQKGKALAERIEKSMWSDALGAYCDVFRDGRGATGVLTPASFMPLFVGVASRERAERMAKLAEDETKFYPLMPAVSYDSPAYTETDYWRGPVWINIAAMAIMGLKRYGFDDLADGYKERILDMCDREKRGLFEYYNSRTGEGLGAIDYGWTATFVMELILNFRGF